MRLVRIGYLCLILIACLALQVCATVYYVDANRTDNSGSGLSWSLAKKTIQAAIDAASSGSEVWVKGYGTSPVYNEHVTMKAGVSLYGGFAGTETARTQRNWTTYVTVIDGTSKDNSVVTAGSGITTATLIDGFTIQNGIGSLSYGSRYGGGIDCNGGSPTISHNIITDNTATNGGGIRATSGTSPIIDNNTIQENTATVGSGVYLVQGTCSNNTICSNVNGSGTSGGAIHSTGSASISTNNIYSNTGPSAICSYYSSTTISNNNIYSNTLTGAGAVWCYGGSPSLNINTISNNSGGSGIQCYISAPYIFRNTISGNGGSTVYGGGIYSLSSSPCITANVITGNTASSGGGIYWSGVKSGSTGSIESNTISGNTGSNGSGLYIGATIDILNNIIALNTTGVGIVLSGMYSPTITYNDVYNAGGDYSWTWDYAASHNISADPIFVGSGDYHLQITSPCIDTGFIGYYYDRDGRTRPLDCDNDGVAEGDRGAYELPDTVAPSAVVTKVTGYTNSEPMNFTIVFSEPVYDFDDSSDVTISGTAGTSFTDTITNPSGDNKTYNVAVTGMTQSGSINLTISYSAARDLAYNWNSGKTISIRHPALSPLSQ